MKASASLFAPAGCAAVIRSTTSTFHSRTREGSNARLLQYGEDMRRPDSDFEYERRFFVSKMPRDLVADGKPNLIVQTYFLAAEGYGLRVRLQVTGQDVPAPLDLSGKEAIKAYMDDFDLCMLAVKGPYVGGTRYEAERELDIGVGAQLSLLGGKTLTKLRYGVWLGHDGWVIDVFAGENRPLIIAECERTSPVIDLEIPQFCTEEVTADRRFSNDELVNRPFEQWARDYVENTLGEGPRFDQSFGTNRPIRH